MRFLVDNALSPTLATLLREAGEDAVHVRDIGLHHASDDAILDRAAEEDRILISADTDFGALLAGRAASRPSVILFRGPGSRRPGPLAQAIAANLPQIRQPLLDGSLVTLEPTRVRVRPLPMGPP